MAEENINGVVITFFSTASAVGKTLICVNMAAELAREGYRVCVVDFDLQFGDVANYLKLTPNTVHNVAQRLKENVDFPVTELLSSYQYGNVEFAVLGAPDKLSEAYNFKPEMAAGIVKRLQKFFDYVLLDTTSMFSSVNLALLDLSTIVTFLGVVDFVPTIKNMKIANETLQTLNYDDNKIRLVLNRSDAATQLDIGMIEERTLGSRFFHVLSNDFKAAQESIKSGVPLVLNGESRQLTKELRELVALYTNRTYQEEVFEQPKEESSGGGWFSRIFG